MRHFFITFALLAAASGCGGGGGGSPSAPAVATPAPTPTPPPAGPLTVSRSSIAFTAPGQSATVDVSEAGYSGAIGFDVSACASVASVTPASLQPAPATFTVTAQAAGSCMLAFTDRFNQHASVAVGVTVTQGSIK